MACRIAQGGHKQDENIMSASATQGGHKEVRSKKGVVDDGYCSFNEDTASVNQKMLKVDDKVEVEVEQDLTSH